MIGAIILLSKLDKSGGGGWGVGGVGCWGGGVLVGRGGGGGWGVILQ